MYKKPEDISPLPSGMMDAFDKAVNNQMGNYNVAQEAPAPEAPSAEAAIPEQQVEESVEVSEGKLNVSGYAGSDAGGDNPKKFGIKVKKVGSGMFGDNVEMTGPDAKLIKFAIANLGVDKKAKTLADVQKQVNESYEQKVAEDNTKEKYRESGKKAEKEMSKDVKALASEDASNDKSDDGEGLDKADPKAAKKKFKDRKDKDIDNDGDSDDSDEYLHKRRQAISKAIDNKKMQNESVNDEQLDEYVGGIGKKIKSKIKQKIGGFAKKVDTGSYRDDKTRVKTNNDRRLDDSKERSTYNRLVALHVKLNTMIDQDKKHPEKDKYLDDLGKERRDKVRADIARWAADVKPTTAKAAAADAKRKHYNSGINVHTNESVNEAKFGDNDLVHIAKANVRGNNNPKTDKIIGYSKAPKNPNKFPDPKSGANAIMRIADAKKKGFKVESADLGKPEGFFSEEMNPTDHVRFNKETNMFCVYDKDGKKVYESEKEEEANKYATDNHDALMGKSDLAEVRGKLNKKGEIEMTKANFAKVHKDYKTKIKGQPYAMQIDPKSGGSALFPVKFIKESVELEESIDDTLKKIRKLGGSVFTDKLTSKSDKTPARLASQTRGKKTVYFVVTDGGYKEYKDLGAVKKDFTIPGNAVDTKIAFDLMSMQGDGDASDIIDTVLNKYKINISKLDKIVKNNLGAKSVNDFLKESVELDEAKSSSGYDLYHRDFSGAMQHAYAFAKKKGFIVDKDEIDSKVAMGPKRPSSGKTNKYILGTNKKKNVHVQVANLDNKRYELNMYIESLGSEDESKVKEIIGKLKGASKAHAGQAKDLEKALNEAPITGIQGKDNKKYSIELDKSGRKVMVRTKNQFGDIKTISLKQAAKLFEASDLEEKKIDPADMDDMKATKGDKESAKMNIIVQLRKAADVKGNLDIVFADGKKQKLPVNIIKIALDKYNSFRKPATKKKLVDGMTKSYRSMLQTLKTIKEYSEEAESKES